MIDYAQFLDSTIWPSETHGNQHVYDMPPQHAVAALHKLLRWTTEFASSEHDDEVRRASLRQTTLGRALANQALGLRDFAPDEDPSLERFTIYDTREMARILLRALMDTIELSATQAAQLATEGANWLSANTYLIVKEKSYDH